MLTGKRAFSVVLLAAVVVGIVVATLLSVEVAGPGVEGRDVVGRLEVVRVAGPTGGEGAIRTAQVEPSRDRTVIPRALAAELGLDLPAVIGADDATPERPVVTVQVTLGARTVDVRADVADRGPLDDDGVVLGRDVIGGALVDVSQILLTDLDDPRSAPVTFLGDTLLGRADPLGANALLALLPVGALVIVVLRYLVGVSTLGTFAPVLVAVAFLQAGVVPALLVMSGIIAVGLGLEPLLQRLRVPRVARLGLLISLASLVMILLTQWQGAGGSVARWGAAFPLVVAAGLVEQLWDVLEADGWGAAVFAALGTLGVAAATIPVLLAEPVRRLGQSAPWAVVLVSMLLIAAAGSYRGLRLMELVRFRGAARRHGAPV